MNHSKHLTENQAHRLAALIHTTPDFPKPGVLFRDLTPALANHEAFYAIVSAMSQAHWASAPTYFLGVESRGFIFGSAMAHFFGCGFMPARKAGKLPPPTVRVSYALEYGEAALELPAGALKSDDRVVVVDDVLATGGTALAAAELVERCGATVVSFDFAIALQELGGADRLRQAHPNSPVNALLTY